MILISRYSLKLHIQLGKIRSVDSIHQKLQILIDRQPIISRHSGHVNRLFQHVIADDEAEPEAEDDEEEATDTGVTSVPPGGCHATSILEGSELVTGPGTNIQIDR